MAYRFKLDETPQRGVRRICREQIERCRRLLSSEDLTIGVHGARKCTKRVRALLRLARPALGGGRYRRENERYRAIAGQLSATRDAQILPGTLAWLGAVSQDESLKALAARLRKRYAARAASPPQADLEAIARARGLLEEAEAATRELELGRAGREPLLEGLARAMRAGVRRLADLVAKSDDETAHELRKSVQLHWRHMQLLGPAWPEVLGARAREAQHVSALLGRDHDLSVLKTAAAADGLQRADLAVLTRAASRAQDLLRREACLRSERLLTTAGAQLAGDIAGFWASAVSLSAADVLTAGPDQNAPAAASGRKRRGK